MNIEFTIDFLLKKICKHTILKEIDLSLAEEYKIKSNAYNNNIPDDKKTNIEKYLDYLTSRPYITNNLNNLLEKIYDNYDLIKKKGLKEKNNWNEEIEKYLIDQCTENSLKFYIIKLLKNFNLNNSKSYVNNQLLIANPKIITKNHNEIIPKEYFKNFHEKGFFYRNNFLLNFNELNDEIKMIDNLGKMEYSKNNNFIKFINIYSNINKDDFPFLEKISKYLFLFSNELNSKINYGFLIHEAWSILNIEKGFNDIIVDGGYDLNDNGNSITLLYFIKKVNYETINSWTDKNKNDKNIWKIYKNDNDNQELFSNEIIENKLFILKSRIYKYRIILKDSFYCIKLLIKGTQDFKNKCY